MDEVSELLVQGGGVIARRDHPRLVGALQWLVRTGRLVALYPGVFCRPQDADDQAVRLRGAVVWHPDGVLMGEAAAAVTFLPNTRVGEIVMSTRRKRRSPPGITLVRWVVPDELVVESRGVRATSAALTALELSVADDGRAIDEALRLGVATLDRLWQAMKLTRYRLGNPRRRQVLHDSKDEPWSPAERTTHKLFRAHGLTGWLTNLTVNLSGIRTSIDITFADWKVAIEIDGYEFHAFGVGAESRRQFERDRWKANELVASGWVVLRFTWLQLTENPDWVLRIIDRTLASRGRMPAAA